MTVFVFHSCVISLWQDLTEFAFSILHSFNTYRIENGMFYCIFILCHFLILWIRNNPCNPHHPQWCLVENLPIFLTGSIPLFLMCMKLSGNGRQTRLFIKRNVLLIYLFIYLLTYVFIIYGLYNDPVSGFL